MSYSRDEVKAITDKVLNMAKADGVEVRFSGGERSATRYANSTITANLVEHDQEVQITVFYGQKSASTSTHQFDDVPCPPTPEAPFGDWIGELFVEGITAGCGGNSFCPATGIPNQQMAAFLVRAFGLPRL